MTRTLSVFLGLTCLLLGSCTQRMICPAYQSAFIYDKDELRRKFSYFLEDSTPKVYTASKNKYLIAEPVSYQQKIRSMQTIAMKRVPVHVPDSLSGVQDSVSMADLDRAARSVIDSTYIVDVPRDTVSAEALDSIYVISKDREHRLLKYNAPDSLEYDPATGRYVTQKPEYYVKEVRYQMEQDNYMWYLRDALVLPDVRLAKMRQAQGDAGAETSKKEKQGLKGFFKNLFRKKKKEEADTIPQAPVQEEEFDYIDEADTTSQAEIPQPGQEEKATKVRKKKEKKPKAEKVSRKKNNDAIETQPEAAPAEKKEEDDDDGF